VDPRVMGRSKRRMISRRGSLQGMVDGLDIDFECLKSEVDSIRTGIGSLETSSMTEQVWRSNVKASLC
jgi:hypothetical protein